MENNNPPNSANQSSDQANQARAAANRQAIIANARAEARRYLATNQTTAEQQPAAPNSVAIARRNSESSKQESTNDSEDEWQQRATEPGAVGVKGDGTETKRSRGEIPQGTNHTTNNDFAFQVKDAAVTFGKVTNTENQDASSSHSQRSVAVGDSGGNAIPNATTVSQISVAGDASSSHSTSTFAWEHSEQTLLPQQVGSVPVGNNDTAVQGTNTTPPLLQPQVGSVPDANNDTAVQGTNTTPQAPATGSHVERLRQQQELAAQQNSCCVIL